MSPLQHTDTEHERRTLATARLSVLSTDSPVQWCVVGWVWCGCGFDHDTPLCARVLLFLIVCIWAEMCRNRLSWMWGISLLIQCVLECLIVITGGRDCDCRSSGIHVRLTSTPSRACPVTALPDTSEITQLCTRYT